MLLGQFYGRIVPAVSIANGQNVLVLLNLAYLSLWFCAAFWAAEPGLVDVLPI